MERTPKEGEARDRGGGAKVEGWREVYRMERRRPGKGRFFHVADTDDDDKETRLWFRRPD